MAAVDHVLEHYDFVDQERLGITGGSYGGFMTNWAVGHTKRLNEKRGLHLVRVFERRMLPQFAWIFKKVCTELPVCEKIADVAYVPD